jgi:DNA-binding transcriptional LysR family regulator
MRASVRLIEIFVRVVETGSFVGAARSMLIDPAAVSRAIKGLEEDLGILLFARSTRKLQLTTQGRRFHADGVRMLRTFDETINKFKVEATLGGQLRVGMGPALGRRMLIRTIPSFQAQYPDINLILFGINETLDVGDDAIDLLIRPRSTRQRGTTHRSQQGIVVRKLFESPILICASPGYLKRAGTPHTPSDLKRHSCNALLTMERDVHDEWHFVKGNVRERIKFESKLTAYGEELREAALAGCGIVRLLECHIEDELRSGALVRLLPDWRCLGDLPIQAIYRKQRPTLLRVNAFVKHLATTLPTGACRR